LRIAVHDYAGHPFQVQLSRELARRGHDILHLHCASLATGKGALERMPGDPRGFSVEGVTLDRQFDKYSLWRRPIHERKYAQKVMRLLRSFKPDLVVSSNTPLISQWLILSECAKRDVKFVFWQQDILGVAIKKAIKRRLTVIGGLVGNGFVRLEARLLRRSDAIITISDDFVPVLAEWVLPPEKIQVIENWAPLDEIPVLPRDNAWARDHDLNDKRVVLYCGTLGLKHNPRPLLELAMRFRGEEDLRVVVVSEGLGSQWLRERATRANAKNLTLLGLQPYQRLPEVLATGDVLVALLEPEAGVFSVPSKVLSYLCAGRPVLALVPTANLAARVIGRSRSGVVVDPHDVDAFVSAAARLLERPTLRAALGRRARQYAENNFDIRRIGDSFEEVFQRAASP
jgi:colanic acid biosynthesis glycosyl transferase WcaI